MKIMCILTSILLICLPLHGEPLTETDQKHVQKRRNIQHVLYETYVNSDRGLASVIGFHYDSFWSEHSYFALAIFGAVGGKRGGYGIASVGSGYRIPLTDKLSFDSKILVGSGGGGGLQAGGGFAVEAQAGISYEFLKNICIDFKYGHLWFPSGTYDTPVVNVGISYEFQKLYLPFTSPSE
ncbi:MAG: hypothetical protein HRT90_09680 [Candidatus Margulisbacteria bacterium]|nr:hypothetical protein [Candidatus Margulisiibacteriota bacterium]